MQENAYRENLINAVNTLADIRGLLLDSIIPLALEGELKEWNDTIETGEFFTFRKEMFEGSKDTNIQHVIALMNQVESTYESLINLNNLKVEEDHE